jgi:hypothetical protein
MDRDHTPAGEPAHSWRGHRARALRLITTSSRSGQRALCIACDDGR